MRLHDHGQPLARADAVSPPATENASGKLLAPNTATGPSAICRCRKSARGKGWRSGCAGSTRTSSHSPALTTWANRRNCWQVRPLALDAGARQAGLRRCALDQGVAQRLDFIGDGFKKAGADLRSRLSIAVERRPGQGAGLFDLLAPAAGVAGARTSSVAGLIAWIASRFPAMVCPPMSMSPVNVMGFPDATDVPMPPARGRVEGKDQPRRCSADHCAYHWRNSAY